MADTGDRPDLELTRTAGEQPNWPRLAFAVAAATLIFGGVVFAAYGLTRPGPPAPVPSFSAQGSRPLDTDVLNVDGLSGNWELAPDGQSFVGYRIDEQYLNLPTAQTVTGRTKALKAHLGIRNRDVNSMAVEADVRELVSDDPKRDETLKTRGLETDRFPRAVFALHTDINLTTVPPPGTEATFHVVGDINIHGVLRPVEIDLKAALIPGDVPIIEVIGAQPITLADFGIEPPDVAGLVDVREQGAFEFKLRFVHT